MSPERLRAVLTRNPFVPFKMRLRDGRVLRIANPNALRPGPELRWLWLTDNQATPGRLEPDAIEDIILEDVPLPFVADRSESGAAMTIEKFDEYLKGRPFVPFTVHTADGAQFEVKSPEFASRTQAGRTIFVSTGGESTEWIDLLLVTRLSSGVENARS